MEQTKTAQQQAEEIQAEISRLESELRKSGQVLIKFGQALSNDPSNIDFQNGPHSNGRASGPVIDWKTIRDKTEIAALIQAIRDNKLRLINLQNLLNNPTT